MLRKYLPAIKIIQGQHHIAIKSKHSLTNSDTCFIKKISFYKIQNNRVFIDFTTIFHTCVSNMKIARCGGMIVCFKHENCVVWRHDCVFQTWKLRGVEAWLCVSNMKIAQCGGMIVCFKHDNCAVWRHDCVFQTWKLRGVEACLYLLICWGSQLFLLTGHKGPKV